MNTLNHLKKDLIHAVRLALARPVWSAAVVGTLALGIGLNTAVFSAVEAMLLRPLAGVERPQDVVQIYRAFPGERFGSLSVPDMFDLRDRTEHLFSGVAAWTFAPLSLTLEGEPTRVLGHMVSANYFEVLGVRPALGRVFLPEEDRGALAHPVVVLSYSTWQTRFGSDPGIVGRRLVINGREMEIVGVASREFRGAMPMLQPTLWVPLMQLDQIRPDSAGALLARNDRFMNGIARLAPSVNKPQADERIGAVVEAMREVYPEIYEETEFHLIRQSEAGIHPSFRDAQVAMSGVVLAVGSLLLLIACVNVANLFLARARDRSREVAVRLALGASRGRIARQMLTESLFFSLVASGVGLLVAHGVMKLASRITLVGLDFTPGLELNPRVLLFALGVTAFAALLAGVMPARQSVRASLIPALKGEHGFGVSGSRLRRTLVVAQMALSIVLLVASGLFLGNLRSAHRLDKGFQVENRLVAGLDPSLQGYSRPQTEVFYRQLEERLRHDPRVRSVAFVDTLPLSVGGRDRGISVPGYEEKQGERMSIHYNVVSPGSFAALGISLRRGEDFSAMNTAESDPVVIVNQAFADRFWPGADPLGKIVRVGRLEPRDFRVIGVAPTLKYRSVGEEPRPFLHFAQAQEWVPGMSIVIHTQGDAEALAPTLRTAVRALDPNLPLANLATLEQSLGIALLPARLSAWALGTLGFLGLALAAIGIYGVMAYSVAQRRREIGIRMALGALPTRVAGTFLREGMTLVGIGTTIGLGVAFAGAQLLKNVLYAEAGQAASQAVVFATVPSLLFAVAVLATWLPARRAAQVDPLAAMREE